MYMPTEISQKKIYFLSWLRNLQFLLVVSVQTNSRLKKNVLLKHQQH